MSNAPIPLEARLSQLISDVTGTLSIIEALQGADPKHPVALRVVAERLQSTIEELDEVQSAVAQS